MSPAQNNKYWFEWAKCRDALRAKGITVGDAKRYELHAKAGAPRSSKEFTNAYLDAVIAQFRATWDDSNLDAQLRQLDQPGARKEAAIRACYEQLQIMADHGKEFDAGSGQERYLNGTAMAVLKKTVKQLTDAEAYKLHGVLKRQADRMVATARKAAKAAPAPADNPF